MTRELSMRYLREENTIPLITLKAISRETEKLTTAPDLRKEITIITEAAVMRVKANIQEKEGEKTIVTLAQKIKLKTPGNKEMNVKPVKKIIRKNEN
jgi:hypothetical protein